MSLAENVQLAGREIEATYEVVVIGGGLAGVCAAISAARHGCKTALVHDRPVLGGNSSSEIRVAPGGANNGGAWARETGIIEELQIEERVRNHDLFRNGLINSQWDLVLYERVRAEENLTLYLNTLAKGVEMAGPGRIAAVFGFQAGTERTLKLQADYFIDCTGDGTIGAAAGAEFRLGREARREFNESLAPEEADNLTQGSSLLFRARDVGRPVPFTPPPWAEDYPTEESLYHRHHSPYNRREYAGYWWIEVGAPFDTIDQNEEICAEALRHLLGVWDHIKNHGEHGAENLALDWIGMLPGKRESRRLIGDYILTEHDVRQNQPFPDRVAYGGWFIDLHTMGGILAQDQPPEALSGNPDLSDQLRIQPYSIPLRCLYSRNIENLFMAGRDISVTHVALGTTRLMLTCAVLGQAVGTAASLCLKYRVTPRTLAQEQVAQLQQTLLKDDCFILNLPNQDPADLAPRATVSATSSAPLMLEPSGGSSSLERYRAQIFPVTAERLETLSLHLESSLDREAEVKVELLPATDIWSFNESRSEPPLTATATVPAGYKGWVDFHLGAATERRLYQVNVYGCAGLAWTQTKPVPGVAAASRKPAWQRWASEKAMYALRPYPPAAPFGPENLISGVARPEKWTNLWMSDPAAKLPQAVTLDFREEVTFDTVYLTFDTFLHLDFDHFPPLYRIPECGRDYALQVWEAGGWKTVVEVEGNYQRRRVHRFAPVTARQLRLEVRATNGDPSARVYEIRVYREGDQ